MLVSPRRALLQTEINLRHEVVLNHLRRIGVKNQLLDKLHLINKLLGTHFDPKPVDHSLPELDTIEEDEELTELTDLTDLDQLDDFDGDIKDAPDSDMLHDDDQPTDEDYMASLVVLLVKAFAQHRRLMFVVDDALYLDRFSVSTIMELARSKEVLFILAAQPSEHRDDVLLEFLALKEMDEPKTCVINMKPHSNDYIQEIVKRALNVSTIPDPLMKLVREKSQGNPLFATELCMALKSNGYISVQTDADSKESVCLLQTSFLDPDFLPPVPPTVAQLIMMRTDRLSITQQMLLKVACVLGSSFRLSALCRAYPLKVPKEELMPQVAVLEAKNFLTRVGESVENISWENENLTFKFRQGFVRDVLLNRLLHRQREILTRRAKELRDRIDFETRQAFMKKAGGDVISFRGPVMIRKAHKHTLGGDWKKRFAILTPDGIEEYDNDPSKLNEANKEEKTAHETIMLNSARAQAVPEHMYSSHPYCFRVDAKAYKKRQYEHQNDRTFVLAVDSKTELDNWLFFIRYVIESFEMKEKFSNLEKEECKTPNLAYQKIFQLGAMRKDQRSSVRFNGNAIKSVRFNRNSRASRKSGRLDGINGSLSSMNSNGPISVNANRTHKRWSTIVQSTCEFCSLTFKSPSELRQHCRLHHRADAGAAFRRQSALDDNLGKRTRNLASILKENTIDPNSSGKNFEEFSRLSIGTSHISAISSKPSGAYSPKKPLSKSNYQQKVETPLITSLIKRSLMGKVSNNTNMSAGAISCVGVQRLDKKSGGMKPKSRPALQRLDKTKNIHSSPSITPQQSHHQPEDSNNINGQSHLSLSNAIGRPRMISPRSVTNPKELGLFKHNVFKSKTSSLPSIQNQNFTSPRELVQADLPNVKKMINDHRDSLLFDLPASVDEMTNLLDSYPISFAIHENSIKEAGIGEIVGILLAAPSFAKLGRIRVDCVLVKSKFRREGLASSLFDHLESFSETNGFNEITIAVPSKIVDDCLSQVTSDSFKNWKASSEVATIVDKLIDRGFEVSNSSDVTIIRNINSPTFSNTPHPVDTSEDNTSSGHKSLSNSKTTDSVATSPSPVSANPIMKNLESHNIDHEASVTTTKSVIKLCTLSKVIMDFDRVRFSSWMFNRKME
eukprot:TRINITY_DN17679_c0_g1_i1.p1 TRINITY_DN17679_c0_g1~~TRINITY_DN17679_c0_g1_i1.p1  ORF type:complete len:1319 (+),score=369.42 TRINITY_DN17679_c0_g1_i1:577-3957(+)